MEGCDEEEKGETKEVQCPITIRTIQFQFSAHPIQVIVLEPSWLSDICSHGRLCTTHHTVITASSQQVSMFSFLLYGDFKPHETLLIYVFIHLSPNNFGNYKVNL